MKDLLALTLSVVFVLGIVQLAIAGQPPREPLDRLWEDSMLAGVRAEYLSGELTSYQPKKSFESARGEVSSASLTTTGIRITDYRGTRFLGLVRGVGWTLDGGLLARVTTGTSSIELYGKEVTRWNGGFLGLDTYHRKEDVSYEFFLLRRPALQQRATILKTWTVPPQDIKWNDVGPSKDVRGFLKYDEGTRTATVTITGLTHPFEEGVEVKGD